MKLYTYYRSQASFRVRIALNLKGVARDDVYLHLEKGDQFAADFLHGHVRKHLAMLGRRCATADWPSA